jgi:hypothetical protein
VKEQTDTQCSIHPVQWEEELTTVRMAADRALSCFVDIIQFEGSGRVDWAG